MKWIVAFAMIVLAGCTGNPESTNPQKVQTKIVGVYEDCVIYRTVTTAGPDITWVRCGKNPDAIESHHVASCGKGCTKVVKTTTIQ